MELLRRESVGMSHGIHIHMTTESVGMSHGIHIHMTTETQQKDRLRHSCKIMPRLVYEFMIPDFEGWKTVNPIERVNTMVCLNPKLNDLLVYNTLNMVLAVSKKVKCKLSVF
jgi:hypothetical protein